MQIEPRALWDDIVQTTAELDDEVARSLRIALFVWLQKYPSLDLKRGNLDLLAAGRWFLPRRKKKLPMAEKGRLLFCLPHRVASNVENLVPVAREAQRRGLLSGIVTAEDCSKELHEFVGKVPIVRGSEIVGQFLIRSQAQSALAVFRAYRRLVKAFESKKPLLASRMQRNAGIFIRELATSVQMGKAFRHVLELWAPACVVSTSDFWPFEYQLCCQASRLGIPSAIVQHGVINYYWWPFFADRYLLWGSAFHQSMLELGAPPDRLQICGMPAADDLFRRFGSTDGDALANRQPICLILSFTHARALAPEIFDHYKRFLEQLVPSIPFVRWKVKLHPAEDSSFYRELGESVFARLEFHPRSVTLAEAVREADVASTIYSTSGLEAMMMQRPLIVFDLGEKMREFAWWPLLGGGVYASTPEEFRNRLVDLTSDDQRRSMQLQRQRDFLSQSFANRGHAAEAVVDFLEQYAVAVAQANP